MLIQAGGGSPAPAGKAPGVNGAVLLRRVAWVDDRGDVATKDEKASAALRAATATALDPRHTRALLVAARARRAAAVGKLAARGRVVRTLTVRPEWRLVVGLGEQTPQDTGITVHGTYGVPVLPGSALKGLARAWARALAEDGADTGDYARAAFGRDPAVPRTTPGAAGNAAARDGEGDGVPEAEPWPADGRVVFLDALPDPVRGTRPGVTVDVMNPHVGEYYRDGGTTPPAEYLQPVPVHFYTVTATVTFTVHLVGRGPDPDLPELVLDDEVLVAWLSDALAQAGLGAKTNAGYGYCTVETAPAGSPSEAAAAAATPGGRS